MPWSRFISILATLGTVAVVTGLLSRSGNPALVEFVVAPIMAIILLRLVRSITQPPKALDPFAIYLLLLGFAIAAGLGLWLLTFVGAVPVVVAVLVMALWLGIHFFRHNEPLRNRRAVSGKCPECGYDLRASFEHCPECGADIPEEIVRRRRIAEELGTKPAQKQQERSAPWPAPINRGETQSRQPPEES